MPESPSDPVPQAVRGEMAGSSPDFRTELAAQLAELIPEAVADGRIDVAKLAELLGDDAADENERFGLFWPGKKRALRAAQAPTSATLKPDLANSKHWDTTQNVFIEGDNLEVLKILQRHYHNRIKLIYIDPPYNTGKDFVYPDNFTEGLETYLEWTRQVNEEGKKVSTNSETAGRFHSNWLNMMYPRLKLARNLLSDDGVIFISIDDNEIDNLTKLGKEVFGERNYLATFIWKSKSGGANDSGEVAVDHEYVVCFSRQGNDNSLGLDPDAVATTSYNNEDENGRFALERLDKQNLGYLGSLDFPIKGPDGASYTVQQRNPESPNARWRWSKETVAARYDELVFKDGNVYTKNYEKPGGKPRSLFVDERFGRTRTGSTEVRDVMGGGYFDNPKPTKLLKTIAAIGAQPDSIVLDFFAGSSSTAHAVMQLNAEDNGNRRFIMVQLPEPTPEGSEARKAGFATIADISRQRIELAGQKIGKGDTGFRAYKLTDTHFAKWRVASDVTPTQLEQHLLDLRDSTNDEASQDDLLTELLLKLGFSLTETIATKTIAGLDVREVGDNRVLASVDKHAKPTLEQLRALVDAGPGKLLVLEDAFHGDDQLKTNLAQYARTRGIELRTA